MGHISARHAEHSAMMVGPRLSRVSKFGCCPRGGGRKGRSGIEGYEDMIAMRMKLNRMIGKQCRVFEVERVQSRLQS